jgi:hypothetical protein
VDRISQRSLVGRGLVILCLLAGSCLNGLASAPQTAQVTQVIHDVHLLGSNADPRPASVSDSMNDGTSVKTGVDSAAELTFTDQTIARLGSNSVFNFKHGTRNLNLDAGVMLLQVPKTAKGARLQTAGVAAAITGTTVMFECYPTVYKFLVLSGTGRLYRPGHLGDSVLVRAGQMVIGAPNTPLSDPVDFDIERFLKTSRFMLDFPPLRSESLMANESQKQQRAKDKKVLIDTNMVIFGAGTSVSLLNPTQREVVDKSGTSSTASPPPSRLSTAINSTAVDQAMTTRK